jgi:hypothetical protein
MSLKDKPNLLFLIAIRNQSLYRKFVLIMPKLRKPVYRTKMLRTITLHTTAHGDDYYTINGKPHREDGPAVSKLQGGIQLWSYNGLIHREGDPAYISLQLGVMEWYKYGNLHRDDGPAIVYWDGGVIWYQNGERIDPPENKI